MTGARTGKRRDRLDRLLVERGLARSRERAQALILAGVVRVDGRPGGKAGTLVPDGATLSLIGPDHPFVGRGGVKLQGALERLGLDPAGRTVLDVGASTGGFTDCLLQQGARRVYALDVGVGQLDWKLRNDPRVVVVEGCNARYLTAADLPERFGLVVVDVSFISLRLILPALPPLLTDPADVLPLVKPQFEVGRGEVGPGGLVTDPRQHLEVLRRVASEAIALSFGLLGACRSPITGAEGNQEFFLHLAAGRTGLQGGEVDELLTGVVDAGE